MNFSNSKGLKPKEKYFMGVIEGKFGYGKTLFMTAFASDVYKNYTHVYANFKLKNIPNFVYLPFLSKPVLLNLVPNSLLLITEAYNYLDRRYCLKKGNVELTHALMEIRKTKIDQFYDVFDYSYLDFRLLDFLNFFVRAKGEMEVIEKDCFMYALLSQNKTGERVEQSPILINMKEYYGYYDTMEITGKKQHLLNEFMPQKILQQENKIKKILK